MEADDAGLPIAYSALERGVAVHTSDGPYVGVVGQVVAAPELDIFHGIVVTSDDRLRFVAADQVGSLYERRVDLRIDVEAFSVLPPPETGS